MPWWKLRRGLPLAQRAPRMDGWTAMHGPWWSYALPDALNHAYTTGEVAGFARWYLDDYPVFCWAEDYGLFVIGLARGSLWKCSIYTSPE